MRWSGFDSPRQLRKYSRSKKVPLDEVAFPHDFPNLGSFEPSVYRELPVFAC